ncbi:MAG: 2-hydroxyacyl-CoA dehydratase, partial [SAR324 cluster bacterium]|nr:2-hydroxyacyl-CoA dehydratase [SAR324 cluster bacterium]
NANSHLQVFCCSVARSILELELSGKADMVDAYAFTSLCDTLINLREIYRRLFTKPTLELSMPITRTTDARHTYLKSVLTTLTQDLETITGQAITNDSLEMAVQLHGYTRELQRDLYQIRREKPGLIKNHDFYTVLKAGFFLPRRVYNIMLEDLLRELRRSSAPSGKRVRIVHTGLVFDPIEIYKIFDRNNIDIVDDDFANGWRTVSKGELKFNNLVEGVTEYLYNPAPCCCLYNPDRDRHNYLVDKVKKAKADGVLFWYVNFCEPDAFDTPQLKARLKAENIPNASIDIELTMTNFDAIEVRINALSEMLGG